MMAARSARPIVMMVTDRRRLAERVGVRGDDTAAITEVLLRQISAATEAGVDLIQLREPDLDARTLTELARSAMRIVAGSPTRVVINGRVDVACAANANGVHLPAHGLSPSVARVLLPRPATVGVSIHASDAPPPAAHVDYALFGTVYLSRSKPAGRGIAGIAGLRHSVEHSDVPVLAIGGVTVARLAELAACGAGGIAAIELFLSCEADLFYADMRKVLESVHEAFDTVRGVS
jgi:thiamine-phosphate pyrophosphorylase